MLSPTYLVLALAAFAEAGKLYGCAGTCIGKAIAATECSSSNSQCICSSNAFMESIKNCAGNDCTMQENYSAVSFAEEFCSIIAGSQGQLKHEARSVPWTDYTPPTEKTHGKSHEKFHKKPHKKPKGKPHGPPQGTPQGPPGPGNPWEFDPTEFNPAPPEHPQAPPPASTPAPSPPSGPNHPNFPEWFREGGRPEWFREGGRPWKFGPPVPEHTQAPPPPSQPDHAHPPPPTQPDRSHPPPPPHHPQPPPPAHTNTQPTHTAPSRPWHPGPPPPEHTVW